MILPLLMASPARTERAGVWASFSPTASFRHGEEGRGLSRHSVLATADGGEPSSNGIVPAKIWFSFRSSGFLAVSRRVFGSDYFCDCFAQIFEQKGLADHKVHAFERSARGFEHLGICRNHHDGLFRI